MNPEPNSQEKNLLLAVWKRRKELLRAKPREQVRGDRSAYWHNVDIEDARAWYIRIDHMALFGRILTPTETVALHRAGVRLERFRLLRRETFGGGKASHFYLLPAGRKLALSLSAKTKTENQYEEH